MLFSWEWFSPGARSPGNWH